MSTNEIVNRLDAFRKEAESYATGNDITDMVIYNKLYDLHKALETLVKIGVLPTEVLEVI